jgi:hypothetical protein
MRFSIEHGPFFNWGALTKEQREARIAYNFGKYPVVVTTDIKNIRELDFCLPDMLRDSKISFIICLRDGRYSLLRNIPRNYLTMEYRDIKDRLEKASEEGKICELERDGNKDITVKVTENDKFYEVNELFSKYKIKVII